MCDFNFYYTVHHNWRWIFETFLKSSNHSYKDCLIPKKLPSTPSNALRDYALFRIEYGDRATWSISQVFAKLDAKDSLYRAFKSVGLSQFMPTTILVDWDCFDSRFIGELPTSPSLLKASLGSGGFGLYFVTSVDQVIRISREHLRKATEKQGFLDFVRSVNGGNIPAWNLQAYIRSIRIREVIKAHT